MGSTPAKPQRKLIKKPPAKKATRKVKASPPQSPDSRDNNTAAKRPKPIVRPSPDAQDVAGRSSQQKAQDRKAVAKATTSGKYVKAQPNLPTVKQFSQQNKASVAGKVAPVLTVLNQTTRPLHAIAGAAKADVHTIKTQGLGHYLAHGSPEAPHAALRGVENKDTTTFSDVFTEAGWKPKGTLGKVAKGAASFGADVVADPTSYVSGGTGSIAEKAGEDAAARVSKKALATGLTQDQAVRAGERARSVAQKGAASKGSGATVKLAGREVPVVRRATAAAGRTGGKTLRKVVPENLRGASRAMGAEVNPNIAPIGVAKVEHAAAARATRTARGTINTGNRAAADVGHGIRRQIGPKNYAQVVDAVEKGDLSKLTPDLAKHAHTLRSQLKGIRRAQTRAGIKVGEIGGKRPARLGPVPTHEVTHAETETRYVTKSASPEDAATAEKAHLRHLRNAGRQEVSRQARAVRRQSARAAAKYDPTPEGISAKTFYHGTAAKGLTKDKLDSSVTSESGLFGPGVYLTSKPGIARGYAKARARGGIQKIYKVKIKPKDVLDLHAPVDPKFVDILAKHGENMGYAHGEVDPSIRDAVHSAARKPGATNESVFTALRRAVSNHSHEYGLPSSSYVENFHMLAGDLRRAGWDALTHIGGGRTGHGPHQVVIALDPADIEQHGLASPVEDFTDRVTTRSRPRAKTLTAQEREQLKNERLGLENKDVKTGADWKRLEELNSLVPRPILHRVKQTETRVVTRTVEGTKRGRATRTTIRPKSDSAVKGYIPRQLTDNAAEAEGKTTKTGVGKRIVKPASSKARTETRTMAELRVKEPGRYREDLHSLVAERLAEGSKSVAQARLNQRIASIGRTVKRDGKPLTLQAGESLYHLKGSDLHKVTDQAEEARAVDPKVPSVKGGRYVVLNDQTVEKAITGAKAQLEGPGIVHAFDKATSGFKRIALATPAFHIRNAIGDTSQALVKQPAGKLAVNLVRGRRVTKALGKVSVAARDLKPHPNSGELLFHGNFWGERYTGAPVTHVGTPKAVEDRLTHRKAENHLPRLTKIRGFHLQSDAKILTLDERKMRDLGLWHWPKGTRLRKGFSPSDSAQGQLELGREWSEWTPAQRTAYLRKQSAPAAVRANREKYAQAWDAVKGYDALRYVNDTEDPGNASVAVINRNVLQKVPTLHLPKYGHTSYEDIADNLVKAGAARSGYTAGELRELSQSGGSKASKVLAPKRAAGETKLGQGAKRLFLNREDIPRLATAIHTLRKGGTYEDAAKAVADTHFDYQDLTPFERNIARRIIPFYTWSARNIPFQAKNVIAHPGKYAGYEKILEEAQKSSDPGQATDQQQRLYKALQLAGVKLPKDYHRSLSDYQQRNAGIPLSWKGHKFTVSAGLPLQDLNEFPGAAGKDQIGEYFQKLVSLTNPIIKDPGELWANYSTFFRDQIQSDDSPLVGAPSFVGSFPKDIQAKLGIVKGLDKRSGKIVYKWPAKTDYVAHALPGAGSQVMRLLTPGANRNGGGPGQAAVKLAGVTSQRIDPTSQAIDLAYARVAEINKRLAGLRQQINPANKYPISSQNPTKEYVDLSAQLQLANEIAYYGKAMRGDKVLPTAGKPKSG